MRTTIMLAAALMIAGATFGQHDGHNHEAEIEILCQEWAMIKMTNMEGYTLLEQAEGERDLFKLYKNHSIVVVKKGQEGEARWKYDAHAHRLTIADPQTGGSYTYSVLELSENELILLYEAAEGKSKKLHFVPKG